MMLDASALICSDVLASAISFCLSGNWGGGQCSRGDDDALRRGGAAVV